MSNRLEAFFFFFYKTSNKNEVKQFPYFKLPVKMSQHRKGSVCLFGWFFFSNIISYV